MNHLPTPDCAISIEIYHGLARELCRLALECIGNSDALYHNVEHTMLVTLAGHDIFKGRALLKPSTPTDYSIAG